MNTIKISIGISFYNSATYMKDAIHSVLNQTFTDFELLLLDDGSTDSSLQIAKSFHDDRITLLPSQGNQGLPARLNQLVQASRGEYFARMDADDIMDIHRLEEQLRYLEAHPDIDILGTFAYSIDAGNHITGFRTKPVHPHTVEEILSHASFVHPTVMARRQWFIDHPYDVKALRMEDFNLWMRTFDTCHLANMERPLLFYREVGIPYLRKYLQSMEGERREYRRARAKINNFHTVMLRNYLKCTLYGIASLFHFRDYLISLRAKRITDASILKTAAESLENAIKQPK